MPVELHDIPGHHHYPFVIEAVGAATATISKVIFRAPFKAKIKKVSYIFDADVTGPDTNTFKLNLIDRKTDGSGTAVLASRSYTAGTDDSAYVARTLYEPTGGYSVSAGQVLDLQREQIGTGMDMPRIYGVVEIEGE